MNQTTTLTHSLDNDGILTLSIDVPNESMNILNQQVMDDFDALYDEIKNDSNVNAVIFTSGKDSGFIAGADINMLQQAENIEDAARISYNAHRVLNLISHSKKPFVAAINGVCLGGGYELALACHYRIASESRQTKFGLPEVMLGLLPGATGTTKLPRILELPTALDLLLTGRQVDSRRAKKMGLINEIVPETILLKAAKKAALQLSTSGLKPIKPSWKTLLMRCYGIRDLIISQARKNVLKKTRGKYPAPLMLLDIIQNSLSKPFAEALSLEAEAFGQLTQTPEAKQLINIYFAQTALKKENYIDPTIKPREVKRLGVIGGGLMGGGITTVSIEKANTQVYVKDISQEGIAATYRHLANFYKTRTKRHILSIEAAKKKQNQCVGTTTYNGFEQCELIIEAVFEDLSLKHNIIEELEALGNKQIVIASNTSSLPIHKIATASKHPENIVGMHYFSPVEKMPLLEIITHDKTSDQALATAVEFGRRQGKTVIVVKDGAGFYVNRILAPYLNAAFECGVEGVPLDHIDETLKDFGFPVGPFKLLDEIGIDTSSKIQPILAEAFGDRMRVSEKMAVLINKKRLGKKVSKGFYRYEKKQSDEIDTTVYDDLKVTPANKMAAKTIIERCVYMMLNEAAMCLDEGIIGSARDGDIGAVFGIGFPPFLGGPFRYMDSLGIDKVVSTLTHLNEKYGERYTPAARLLKMAEENRQFYS